MTTIVRTATSDDARAIATIRIETWRAAYGGLVEPAILAALNVEHETERRAARMAGDAADPRLRELIAEVDGEPVGWAAVGPCRDHDGAGRGELYALYALPAHWSTGVGHALLADAERALREFGFEVASLWVLDGNERAARFYERHGWHEDGVTKDDVREPWAGLPRHVLHERRRVRDLRA